MMATYGSRFTVHSSGLRVHGSWLMVERNDYHTGLI